MQLSKMTWKQVEAYLEKDDRMIFPIGSTEQHGPKAVLGTDFLIPQKLAELVAEETGTIASPVQPYGMSMHHMSFPGTLPLKPSTLIQVFNDLIGALARHGFKRILILNGHGGNIAAISSALCEVCDTYLDLKVKLISWWEPPPVKAIIDEAFGEARGMHGTPAETSVVMYLQPGIVSEDPVPVMPRVEHKFFLNRYWWAELHPDGSVNADVNLASAQIGEQLLNACVQALVAEMEDWEPTRGQENEQYG